MENFQITYHPLIKKIDIPRLGPITKKVGSVIYEKLSVNPLLYGKPLHSPLKNFRKLRIGDYRVVYHLVKYEVRVLVIAHRKEVYEIAKKRLKYNLLK